MKTYELVSAVLTYYEDPMHYPGVEPGGGKCTYYKYISPHAEGKCAIGALLPSASQVESYMKPHTWVTSIDAVLTTFQVFKDISSEEIGSSEDIVYPEVFHQLRQELINILPEDLESACNQRGFLNRLQSCHDEAAQQYSSPSEKSLFLSTLRILLTKLLQTYQEY